MRERIRKWLFPELWELRELYYALQTAMKQDLPDIGAHSAIIIVGTVRDSHIETQRMTVTGTAVVTDCYMK